MILRTFVDTFTAQHTVNRLYVFFLSFRINAFNPHRAGMIAGTTFRTGCAVLFQLKQIESFEKPHQIPHRADNAPKPFDEKAAYQKRYCKKTSQIQICPIASLCGCKPFQWADVTKITACKSKSQKQDDPYPFDRLQKPVHSVCNNNRTDMQCLPQLIHQVLQKPCRAKEAAKDTPKKNKAKKRRYDKHDRIYYVADRKIRAEP